jgi:hypothetical protein
LIYIAIRPELENEDVGEARTEKLTHFPNDAGMLYSNPTLAGKGGVGEARTEKLTHFPNDVGMLYMMRGAG